MKEDNESYTIVKISGSGTVYEQRGAACLHYEDCKLENIMRDSLLNDCSLCKDFKGVEN